jgi:hypothetical protein
VTGARLASSMLVSALIRKVEAEGGSGAVLAKGDSVAGALLLLLAQRGQVTGLRERGLRPNGEPSWIPTGPADPGNAEALTTYIDRRRRFDSDLWVVELDGMPVESLDALLDAI